MDRSARLLEDAAAVRDTPGPLRFAVPEDILVTPSTDGKWESLPDGGRVWRLRVISPGATDLNFGFTRFRMPEGAALYVIAEDEMSYLGPYGHADNTPHGQFWTPLVPGERAVIELRLPAGLETVPLLELTRVGCGYRDFFKRLAVPESGSCNIDVICPEGDPWRSQIQSVADYKLNGAWDCTGAMINNAAGDLKPYFLTANHCGVSSGNAATVVAYWNFFSPTCGQHGGGSLSQVTTGGATFRANYSSSDFCLIEFVNPPDPGWNVYWSGWDRSGADPSSAVTIHHPNNDEKSISFEDQALTTTTYLQTSSPGDGTHFRIADWDVRPSGEGTTEPGSSGSPLYSPEKRIIGQLHGGYAACGNNSSDWYGKLSVSWTGGGSNSSRLSNWLDPGGTGVTTLDGKSACASPGVPTGVSAAPNGDNRIRVQWTAGSPAGATYSLSRSASTCEGATSFSPLASGITGTAFDDETVTGGVTYAYKVQALDGAGVCPSVQSSCAQATATGPCFAAPSFAGVAAVANPGNATCTLDLSWGAGSALCAGPLTYSVYRSAASPFTPSPSNRIASGITGTSYSDTGALATGATYHYIVRAVDASNGVEEGNTTDKSGVPTGPASPTTVFTEGFEGAVPPALPPGWAVADVTGTTGDWATSTATVHPPGIAPHGGSNLAYFNALTATSGNRTRLYRTSGFSLSGASGATLTLWMYHDTANSSKRDRLTVQYSTDGGSNWSAAGGAIMRPDGSTGWKLHTLDLSAAAGQGDVRLAFLGESAQGNDIHIDDVAVARLDATPCSTSGAANPKEASPTGNMTASRGPGNSVGVAFTNGCGTTDHAIYWTKTAAPTLGALDWSSAACGLGMSGSGSFDTGALNPGEWVYFVVVGQNAAKEGSYGKESSGAERPEAMGVGTCDKPQDLTGTCP